ncbi:hypothetical protein FBULB1_8902 [Fusarium bulbicola]|nr:hypothetical protein FBULB1_8902 [Fusarium bulbicola]
MADGLSVASGVTALVAFAFKSSTALYTTICGFRSQDKNARALKNELADLRGVLQSLAETVDNNDDINFDALQLPLLRCGITCEEYGDLIARYTKHPSSSRPSFRDWTKQQYLKCDITDIREILAGYKSTFTIALADANMRVNTSISSEVLQEYKDMIRDTTSNLQDHMNRLDQKLRALAGSEVESPSKDEPRWMAIREEKQSTQEGLKICSQLSAQTEQLEPTSKEHLQFLQQPSERKFIRSELGDSCQSLVSRLQTHERNIYNRIQTMKSSGPLSGDEAIQIAEFQETIESIRQCMNLVAGAGQILSYEQRDILDDPERMSLSSASSSDLDTLFSKGYSDGSSEYSVSGLSSTAEEQLVELILDHTVLWPLLQRVSEATTSTGSQRQITHFLHRYGKDLQQEAKTTAQLTAAGFVRRSARRVAIRISTSIQSSAYNSIRNSSTDEPGRTKVLRRYLESLSLAGTFANVSNADEETDLVPPDDLGDDEPQSLEEVRAFLLSSRAFASLCDAIREWLKQHKDPPIQTCHNDFQESMNPQSSQSRREHKWSVLAWIWSRLPNSAHEISRFTMSAVQGLRVLCEPRISPNQDRLRWRCSCGQMLYGDFDNTNSQAVYELAKSLKTLSSTERSNITSPSCNTRPTMQEQASNPSGLPPCDAEATSNFLGSGHEEKLAEENLH